jgi:hypothetical protein
MRVLIFSLGVTLAGCSEFPISGGGQHLVRPLEVRCRPILLTIRHVCS